MAATGYTPISLYYSTTAAAVPTSGNLVSGELAINITDGKLYYKNNGGTVTLLASSAGVGGDVVGPASATANGIALFNSTTGKLIKDSAASDGLIYGLTVGRGAGAVATNTVVGASALASNSTGSYLTAIGYQAGNANTGNLNLFVGALAGNKNTSGVSNSFVGGLAGSGDPVGYNNTTGGNNSAFGSGAFFYNTTGSYNTANGVQALYNNTTASNNTAVGYQAMYSNTTGDGTALGYRALYTATNRTSNTAVGNQALYSCATDENTAVGALALRDTSTGTANTAMGVQAGVLNTTGSSNTAIGYVALNVNTTGVENTAIGRSALAANTTASYNTAVGRNSLLLCTTGTHNTVIGHNSGDTITTGIKNTILGRYNGNQGSLDIRTASNYIVLSDGDGNPRMYNNATDWYDSVGKLRAVPQSGSSKTASYTLATTDVGEYILLGASGAIVIPDATFAAGDVITIFNNTASTATITCSITTAYIAGTFTDKATMTLAAAGVATVLFITSTLCVVSGNVT